jgi:hypothetical protein
MMGGTFLLAVVTLNGVRIDLGYCNRQWSGDLPIYDRQKSIVADRELSPIDRE